MHPEPATESLEFEEIRPFQAPSELPPPLEHVPAWSEFSSDDGLEPLPPLEDELRMHGGAHLYTAEGDQFLCPIPESEYSHPRYLRLPEDYQAPEPLTFFAEFLGNDPIKPWPALHWFGKDGYVWEPQFVGYGSHEVFASVLEEGPRRRDLLGQQLIVDLDLRVTGTERFHVQYRPLGEAGTGGSYYQFSDPAGYVDNATGVPDRYWFEWEMQSVLGGLIGDPTIQCDLHTVIGKVPFMLQNNYLMNDEVLGVVVNKNNLIISPFSNINTQLFYFPADVDAFPDGSSDLFGTNINADMHGAFFELTYAHLEHSNNSSRNTDYAALGAVQFFGHWSIGGRAMAKWGDRPSGGNAELLVLESNYTHYAPQWMRNTTGIEYGVFYLNGFYASEGWKPISGGNFNRISSSFEVNPLLQIARRQTPILHDTPGLVLGVQLFRHEEDESLIPEIAWQHPGVDVFGAGLRYLRQTGKRSFMELRGLYNWSPDRRFDREGVMLSHFFLF